VKLSLGWDYLEVTFREVSTDPSGRPEGLGLTVAVSAGGFTGRNDTGWVFPDVFERFLADLRILQERLRGAAELESVNPAEFRLRVAAADRAGHMSLEGILGKVSYGAWGRLQENRIAFSFELDQTFLPGLLGEFEDLGAPLRRRSGNSS
jgi:hypothetical protein